MAEASESTNYETDLVILSKDVEKIFKCHRCEENLKAPFSHCCRGHVVCNLCCSSACPSCSGPIVSSSKLEQLLELLPKPCQYSAKGCQDVSVRGRHELICEYRTIACKVGVDSSCVWTGTVKDWKKHVTSQHSSYKLNIQCDVCCDSQTTSKKINFQSPCNSDCIYIQVKERVFLFFMKKKKDKLYFASQYIPTTSDMHTYYIQVRSFCSTRAYCHTYFNFATKAEVLDQHELLESYSEFYGDFSNICSEYPEQTLEFKIIQNDE